MIRNGINSIRGLLSYKACFFYVLISGACLFFTFLVYKNQGFAPRVWHGTCGTTVGKESAYAVCDIDGRKVTDTISLKLLHHVLSDKKDLLCDADALDGLTCTASE